MSLTIGKDARTKRPASLSENVRGIHTHVIGSSGRGKTKLLELMMRHDLKNRNGFLLIDPDGDVYSSMLTYCTRMRYDDRVILIDPNDTDWSVGLNYLEYDSQAMSASAHADIVMRSIAKAFGDEELHTKPELRRWLKATLQTLAHTGQIISDAYPFLSREDTSVRDWLVAQANDAYLFAEWREFQEQGKRERNQFVTPVLNRISLFYSEPIIRRMVCQPASTIDFRQAMDEGKAILVNLACQRISAEQQRLLAVILIDKILTAGYTRTNVPEPKRRRFYLYLDEFQDYVCDDIAQGLRRLRKYQLSFILAHQELRSIRDENLKVFASLMANTDIKISFAVSRDDAELMVGELFRLDGKHIKDELQQTKFWPHEETRKITGRSGGETRSLTSGRGHGSATITGEAWSGDMPMLPIFQDEPVITHSEVSSSTHFESASSSEGYFDASSEAEVPWYTYKDFQETSSRQFYSVEEKRERFIAWLKEQPTRRAQFFVRGRGAPVPIITTRVDEVRTTEYAIEQFKQSVYAKYATLAAEADEIIESHRQQLLADAQGSDTVERWGKRKQP